MDLEIQGISPAPKNYHLNSLNIALDVLWCNFSTGKNIFYWQNCDVTKWTLLIAPCFMTNLDSIFKSRDITLPTKVRLWFFQWSCMDVRVGLWRKLKTLKNDAFELWCWRRPLRVPWTARRSSQSILKEISSGCSLEGLILKLKLQYFGHLMQRVDSLEKILPHAGRDWG